MKATCDGGTPNKNLQPLSGRLRLEVQLWSERHRSDSRACHSVRTASAGGTYKEASFAGELQGRMPLHLHRITILAIPRCSILHDLVSSAREVHNASAKPRVNELASRCSGCGTPRTLPTRMCAAKAQGMIAQLHFRTNQFAKDFIYPPWSSEPQVSQSSTIASSIGTR